MYKTAVITDEISQDIIVAAKLAQEYNLDALEIRSVDEKNPFELELNDYLRIKNVATDHGLAICAISSPFFKCNIADEKTILAHYEGFQRCIEAAHILSCSIIRGFSFWRDTKAAISFEKIIQLYQPALNLAKNHNIVIVIESEPSVNTYNIALLADFLERADSSHLAAIWYPGNEIADPEAPPPYPDGYFRLKPFIHHVHLKDMRQTEFGADPALLGEGDVDYNGALNRLLLDSYSGYVSVETHYRMNKKLDESTLVKPQGSGFSAGGYDATVAYLETLHKQYGWSGRMINNS